MILVFIDFFVFIFCERFSAYFPPLSTTEMGFSLVTQVGCTSGTQVDLSNL